MVDFFRLWLRDHTGLHDRMMAAYLRNFGRAHDQAAS
jgi:hemerythrin